MQAVEITGSVKWVGMLDPQLRVFDVVMRAEHGTTYNSYLVAGSEKIALIDANKGKFSSQYVENLAKIVDPARIDYIILNHMEPDHSGALPELLAAAPNARLVMTRAGKSLAENIVNRPLPDAMIAAEGDTIDLGGKTLEFFIEPFLHWPDTMFTYLREEEVLFPCDFLGAHYCDDRLFDDLSGNYDYAFKYYFQAIMRPFKEHVLRAVARLEAVNPKIICPSHGPIIRKGVKKALEHYKAWAAPEDGGAQGRLLVLYVSAYGNTAKMVEAVAEGARLAGADVEIFDLTGTDEAMLLDEVEKAGGFALGSCTINGDALPHAWSFLSSLLTVKIKGKTAGAFGSYGWSGEGPVMLAERMKGLKLKVPEGPVRVRLVPTPEDLESCRAFGANLAKSLKS